MPLLKGILKLFNPLIIPYFRNEMRLAEKDRRNATELEWQQVALVLDRFLLVVFVIGTAVTSLTILYQRHLDF